MSTTTKPPLLPPANTLPLAPRMDRLDSIMKILEDQKNVARSSVDSTESNKIPIDIALKEAQLKGSIMDRVRSLENRLLQLCLEIESRGTSIPDSSVFQVLKDTTSNQVQPEKIKSKTKLKQMKPNNESNDSRKKPTISDEEEKSISTKKKAKASTWFHLKLLGC